MNKHFLATGIAVLLLAIPLFAWLIIGSSNASLSSDLTQVELPSPQYKGTVSLEETLKNRRSKRAFINKELQLADVSQVLWAAQGVNDERNYRTAPSAGAIFGLETYIVVGKVEGLSAGLYKYNPLKNTLTKIIDGDLRYDLSVAALDQVMIEQASATIVFVAVYERVAKRYGDRAVRYTDMEAGHAGQNVYLQCESLGLGTVAVGAFYDDKVKNLLKLPEEEHPIYMFPFGFTR